MKNLKTLLAILVLIFSINNNYAQFGGNQGGGFGGNQGGGFGGNNGRMSQMNQGIPQNDKPEEESEKSKKARLDAIVSKLKTELTLDELQVYAVQGVIAESMKKQAILFKKEVSEDEKFEEMQALSENTDRKIMEFLNKEQKKKYIEITADRKEKMKEMADKRSR